MTTETVLHCDADLCRETFAVRLATRIARGKAKRCGWVEALINGRKTDFCPAHSNLRTNQ